MKNYLYLNTDKVSSVTNYLYLSIDKASSFYDEVSVP